MKALFLELPPFEKYREDYLSDDAYKELQRYLLDNPEAGDVMQGTGGLRKVRFSDPKRGKGKRGGTRVIYYWWGNGNQFWLFTIFNKDEMIPAVCRHTLGNLFQLLLLFALLVLTDLFSK